MMAAMLTVLVVAGVATLPLLLLAPLAALLERHDPSDY